MGDAMKADGAFIGQDVSVTPLIGKLRLHIQGYVDKEDFFISPLKHEDVILGAPWFDRLAASIRFPERKISFKFREKDMYISAQESGSTIPLVNDQAFDKSIKSSISAYMIFVKDSLSDVNKTQVNESGMHEELELSKFLNQFQDVFIDNIPGELPPKRGDDDHAIELISGALISARKLAKEQMAAPNLSSTERAVFDGRQKALKLCSNALYGFTGAGASPQQALPIADSCLSMGAAACKRAVELVKSTFKNAKVLYAQTDSVFIQFCGATSDEAVKLGKEAADVISKAFPSPMSLKFEKVLCPFLLLQVNRYAGKDVTCPTDTNKEGRLFVRGLESERRDVPPFVRAVSKIALQEILLNQNVGAALDACKYEIKRLLSGKCSMIELIMTGGLWRVDDHDISRLASATKSPKKEAGGAATAEEGRGPHVALAVRLKRNDPERQFHIGERIQYVLVKNSSKLQDDMAEDPLNAIIGNMQLNYQVYLENKLRKPLESILEYVAHSSQIHDVFSGSHTVASPFVSSTVEHGAQASMRTFFKSKTPCLNCRKPLDGVDEYNVLCKACKQSGASQSTLISLVVEKREYERKLFLGQGAYHHIQNLIKEMLRRATQEGGEPSKLEKGEADEEGEDDEEEGGDEDDDGEGDDDDDDEDDDDDDPLRPDLAIAVGSFAEGIASSMRIDASMMLSGALQTLQGCLQDLRTGSSVDLHARLELMLLYVDRVIEPVGIG
ncbi:hypothetical protein L7F22_054456 [Adiantum nelumboides]|nr:hypothetical protein [Adiantum nelumboides]